MKKVLSLVCFSVLLSINAFAGNIVMGEGQQSSSPCQTSNVADLKELASQQALENAKDHCQGDVILKTTLHSESGCNLGSWDARAQGGIAYASTSQLFECLNPIF